MQDFHPFYVEERGQNLSGTTKVNTVQKGRYGLFQCLIVTGGTNTAYRDVDSILVDFHGRASGKVGKFCHVPESLFVDHSTGDGFD